MTNADEEMSCRPAALLLVELWKAKYQDHWYCGDEVRDWSVTRRAKRRCFPTERNRWYCVEQLSGDLNALAMACIERRYEIEQRFAKARIAEDAVLVVE